ncbi:MAG TPA: hypothetical protein VFT89_07285 [Rhizobiaceae bacterium]|nr:hypothetical protein [Rhizobiaceae bacterium]
MLTSYDKFLVALIVAIVAFIRSYSGIDLGIDDATATAIVGAIGAFLVWLVPNRKAE